LPVQAALEGIAMEDRDKTKQQLVNEWAGDDERGSQTSKGKDLRDRISST